MAEVRRGRRVTGIARDRLAAELRKRYERGASIRSLAMSTGRSYRFVRRLLAESGVTFRGTGNANPCSESTKEQDAPRVAERADAHRLIDQVPDSHVPAAVELLHQLSEQTQSEAPRRRFRTVGVFDGEPDLGHRTKEILRQDLGGHIQSA